MNKSAALTPILLLIAARAIGILSFSALDFYQNFFYNVIDGKVAYLLLMTIPAYLIAVAYAFALGLSITRLQRQRFQDKRVGVALIALSAIMLSEAFDSVLKLAAW